MEGVRDFRSNDLQQPPQQAVIHLAQISGQTGQGSGPTSSPPVNPPPPQQQQQGQHAHQQPPPQQAIQQQQPQPIQSPVSPPPQQPQQQTAVGQYRPDNRFIAQSPFQSQSYVSQQAFTQPGAFVSQAQYAPQQTTFVQQQQLVQRGSPYGTHTHTALSSGSSYNLQEPCNRLGVRPPLQYPLQSTSPQQHPLAPAAPAQAAQTQVDPNTGGAFFVTVLDFPDAEATPEALYYQPEDIDSELGNRHPPLVLTASRTKEHEDPDLDPMVAAAMSANVRGRRCCR